MAEYLFAYGSLIGSDPNSEIKEDRKIPVRVAGLKRGWYIPVPQDGDTGLGIIFQEDSSCNGVLIESNESHLTDIDSRETQHGYYRTDLPIKALTPLADYLAKIDKIWVYAINNPTLPTAVCPIAQSYLDVVLSGCLEISEEFASEFILTTDGWDYDWINDRQLPRYRRPIIPDANRIDTLLQRVIPRQLSGRKSLNK